LKLCLKDKHFSRGELKAVTEGLDFLYTVFPNVTNFIGIMSAFETWAVSDIH